MRNIGVLIGEITSLSAQEIESIFPTKYAYEVIRLINSKAIFLHHHIQRLVKSCYALNYPPLNTSLLEREIELLIKENALGDINIKIIIQEDKRAVFPIESHYPSKEDYNRGVCCSLLFEERENPSLKVNQASLRKKANEQIKLEEVFESILVNKKNQITEGSRSNLFFIKDHKLYTAPDHLVLGGITRLKVLEICEKHAIPIVFDSIDYRELSKYQAAFICGTSPGVLPIRSIGNVQFDEKDELLGRVHSLFHEVLVNNQ
ncbi:MULTISPECIES: aminotransferase class IV [unclassified Lentimicrobium]|uniref:aminotransferase class IV n=1 Tax=unclassified Lentimicrobium TaxID=2677434 RepID=UPI001555F137|nr:MULTISPECIES: aminotransferase class IV [unclassified Lentimicrobium]NPD45699.1 aminotransferase class IV [Lentimicrobium sp. S6]NPD85578.1 aminotransferase class IV [Lentimicrobium sp. L6]